ncbi:MAG: hypothetical protein RJA70_1827, partial [Pseudomonadota bacterium]
MSKNVPSFDDLTLGSGASLEELVDRGALKEMVASFYELFRVPLRVFSDSEGLMAEAAAEPELYTYLNGFPDGRKLVAEVIQRVKSAEPQPGVDQDCACATGVEYRIAAICLDGRRIGRFVLGPFLPPTVKSVPRELFEIYGVDPEAVKRHLARVPRAKNETVAQIARHLERSLDLILFSGHKALLTSSMHLASVRESFRDLEEKNGRLQEAYDRLKELDQLKSNFLATVSHELRTPLTSIIGYSEMLAEGIAGELTGEQKEFVTTIHEKGIQLLELISGLLDLSKLESGTLAMRRTEVALDLLVADVLQTLVPMALRKHVTVVGEVDPGLPRLVGDATRLRQILTNLCDNALKFTPEHGRVTIRVEMTHMDPTLDSSEGMVLLAAQQPAARITVSDTGIGVPDEAKEKVFDAFYQVDSGTTRQSGGTGLGLSIVKRLVEGHQGQVFVRDNSPVGAEFVVTI